MNYWRGIMNWPLIEDWKCEICEGFHGLTWGLQSGICRCNCCHAEYQMLFAENNELKTTETPICLEDIGTAKLGWKALKTPLSEWEQEDWDSFAVLYRKEENKHNFTLEVEN